MNLDANGTDMNEDLPADEATMGADPREADSAQQGDGQAAGGEQQDGQQGSDPAALDSFLDTLTGGQDDPHPDPQTGSPPPAGETDTRQRGPDGRFVAREATPHAPPTQIPEGAENAEEAELLAGVKSERGRERMRQIFAERRDAQTDLGEIREVINSAGVTPEDFAEYLEFARLMSSGDAQGLRAAAQMLEGHRARLYRQLGIDAPGVDGLAEFPDLAQAVQNTQISREHALEIARGRRQQQTLQQQQQAEHTHQQEQQQFSLSVEQGKSQMAQFLASRQHEIDHPARMRAVSAYFSSPAKVQEFAATWQPQQWAHALRLMYEGIQAPPTPRQATPAPMRARPAPMGRPASAAGESPEARTMSILDGMGL